jgi:hypothetical protein
MQGSDRKWDEMCGIPYFSPRFLVTLLLPNPRKLGLTTIWPHGGRLSTLPLQPAVQAVLAHHTRYALQKPLREPLF